MTEDRNERAARAYARAGWPVFPVLAGCKEPATKHGFKDATTDPDQISRFWRSNPERNVGIATGAPGPDVVDVDNHGERGNGFAALNQIKREGLVDHPRAIVRTPSGGVHLYFAADPERKQGNGSLARHHVDFRGTGGYVVAPPSVVGQRPYEVVRHEPSAATVDFAAIRGLLDPQPDRKPERGRQADGQRDVGHLPDWVARQEKGNRNKGLFWAGNRALEAGHPELLDDLARAAIQAGHPEREAWRTVRSLREREPQPRPFEREAGS